MHICSPSCTCTPCKYMYTHTQIYVYHPRPTPHPDCHWARFVRPVEFKTSNASRKPHLGWDPAQFLGSSLAKACTRRLLAKMFQCQSNPTFSCHFLAYLSSTNSRPPTHRFLIRIGGLRAQLSSLIPFLQLTAVESLGESWASL